MVDSGAETGLAGKLEESDVLRCLPGVRALLLRRTGDPELTNDLAQEVMVAVILAIREGRIREPAALTAYVLQTAKNMLSMHRRKMQPVAVGELPEVEPMWSERPRSPLEHCEEAQLNAMALAVLEELPTDRDRAIVRGFYMDGCDKPELMTQLGLDRIQFDRVISRARGRMRDLLHKKLNEETGSVRGASSSGVCSSQSQEARR